MRTRRSPRVVIALAFVAGCIGPQAGHRDGYEGPTGPPRVAETQLRGQVIDLVTSSPIAGATVRIDGISTTSGGDGMYTLQHLTMAAGNLEGISAGYDTTRVLIPLDGGDKWFTVRLRAAGSSP